MKILALDSSGKVASVALAEDDRLIGEYTTNTGHTHSETLLPMVDALQEITEQDLSTVDAIAVAYGPGSFTGLRIGSATAKGLSFAWNKPIIEIPTVDALAYNLAGAEGLVCPILDARRQQTYTGIYQFSKDDSYDFVMEILKPQSATTIAELVEELNGMATPDGVDGSDDFPKRVTFLGDGIPVFDSYLQENLRLPFNYAPLHMRLQSAASVAALAMVYAREGKFVEGALHRPEYLRETQAERERKK